MKIFDISWPISQAMTAYKDRSVVKIEPVKTFEKDAVRETLITLGAHSGTHVDAASHFLKAGASIDHLNLQSIIGPCAVIDLSMITGTIMPEHLENHHIEKDAIVLLKTSNSKLDTDAPFDKDFVYLNWPAARWLAQKKIKAVGIDYLGIERNDPEHKTHIILFENNITIIEGLRLGPVAAGNYFLICLPLLIPTIEAAPARAILLKDAKL